MGLIWPELDPFSRLSSPGSVLDFQASDLSTRYAGTAIEQIWHIYDSPGQIMALPSRQKPPKRFKSIFFRPEAASTYPAGCSHIPTVPLHSEAGTNHNGLRTVWLQGQGHNLVLSGSDVPWSLEGGRF